MIARTLLLLLLAAAPARAHDSGKGFDYPWECCSNRDCEEISEKRVKPVHGGYLVDGKFFIRQAEVRQSPVGYHACFPTPDVMKCFWAPPSGS